MSARGVRRPLTVLALFTLMGLALGGRLEAAGINTNVALPVREGGFVYRTQVRFLRATVDPSSLDRDITAYAISNILVYGATERTTLFGIVPYVVQSLDLTSDGTRQEENVQGFADLTFLLRQQIYARDAVQRTERLGLLGGLEVPTGKDEFSSHSTDFLLGGVYTLQSGRHELDADLIFKVNTEARDVDPGEELQYDVAYQLRVRPWQWPERGTPSQIYAVIEANAISAEKAISDGSRFDDTGGTVVLLSPGIQWVTPRVIYEVSLQFPVIENLNGDQVETDLVALSGVRIQF